MLKLGMNLMEDQNQIIIDPRILNKYKTLQLEMQVGDLSY